MIWTLRGSALVLAVFVIACTESPTWPQPQAQTSTPAVAPTPTPTPTPAFDLSPFVGVWKLTLRLTEVERGMGGDPGCVLETMRSQMGVPSNYTLTVTQKDVTLTNPSGDYACTFPNPKTDSNGFTTYETTGFFSCDTPALAFRCGDGTVQHLWSWAQDITARVSGTEMSGVWGSYFELLSNGASVQVGAEFTGRR